MTAILNPFTRPASAGFFMPSLGADEAPTRRRK